MVDLIPLCPSPCYKTYSKASRALITMLLTRSYHKFLLLGLTLFFDQITPFPTPSPIDAISNPAFNLTDQPNKNFLCFPGKFMREDMKAKVDDCFSAAFNLPQAWEPGLFQKGGGDYKLPLLRQFGGCEIQVSIADGKTERTTWTAIGLRVTQLITACGTASFPDLKTGGEIAAGTNGYLSLYVGKRVSSTRDMVAGNTGNGSRIMES